MRNLAAVLALGLASVLVAQTFEEYLSLRRQYGITQATSSAALQTLVGTRTLEVKGVVRGVVSGSAGSTILLESPDGDVMVSARAVPDWLRGGSTPARLLIRAQRPTEDSRLEAVLIGVAQESQVAAEETRRARAAAPPARRPANPPAPGGRPPAMPGHIPRIADWNLSIEEAAPFYAAFIMQRNRRLSEAKAFEIARTILGFSVYYGVDARLIMAMVLVESGFRPEAVSRAGAMGLGQLMPGTARGMGITDAFDTQQNLYGTVRKVRGHLERFQKQTGDSYRALILTLAAYNAGSGAVRRHGGVPPFRETEQFIERVISTYRRLIGEE